MPTLFFGGDVMIGRAVDQLLPSPCPPQLYEPVLRDARDYLRLAREASGPLPAAVDLDYVWGDALLELERRRPEARIVNLETAVTRRDEPWPGKSVHYRVSPENARCLTRAGLHVCCLANNHVLDWGHGGLVDTITTLDRLGIGHAGAGVHLEAATQPARLELQGGQRVVVFSCATSTSGVPPEWAATPERPGVWLVDGAWRTAVRAVRAALARWTMRGDLVVVSIHWGGNWGYRIPPADLDLAHALVDEAGVHVVHGHSSHHVKAIEVRGGALVLYGCGDLVSDYEGIAGHEPFRADLGLLYFPTFTGDGQLEDLAMMPSRLRRLQITRASVVERRWLTDLLTREGARFHTAAEDDGVGGLVLAWRGAAGTALRY